MKLVKGFFIALLVSMNILTLVFASTTPITNSDNTAENGANIVNINAVSQQAAGITTINLQPQALTALIPAPGEVIPNANLTTKVTTRVAAQVIKRWVQEGQHVKAGDVLATLSSVDMAKVQGNLLLATQEWERVKSLGKDAISGKRYSEAQVAYQQAYSTALSYGMTETEIAELLRVQKPSQAKGEFNLLATRDGTVFNINFTEGELIEPGFILLQIVDEKTVWVDAKLPPDLVKPVKINNIARILVSGRTLIGRVIQIHHQLDETTRTQSIRLEIPNVDDLLHPGQFVNCRIETGLPKPVMALPINAVLRTSDGDWAVYVEKQPGYFQQVEVKVIETIDGEIVIEGIPPGTLVVTNGAFFVHSELNKKGFDVHGH